MTNLSPSEPPQSPPPKKPILDFDEMVAVVIAFLTIGAILFWSLGSRREGLIFQQWQNFFSAEEEQETATIPDQTLSEQLPRTRPDEPTTTTPFTARRRELPRSALEQPPISLPIRPRTTAITPPQPSPRATIPQTPPIATEPSTSEQLTFQDVPTEHWARPFIAAMAAKQIVNGLSDDTFKPDRPITRAELASLIGQTFESQPTSETINFQDVSQDTEMATAIETAVRSGFMKGYSGNIFRPEQEIPRYQVLVALASGLNLQPTQNVEKILERYDDIDRLPDWAKEKVASATEAGLVVNRPEFNLTSLHPDEPATRAEVTAMIHQALVYSGKLKAIPSDRIVPSP